MIDFSQQVIGFNGEPMRDNADGDAVLTLGRAVANALCVAYQDEQNVSGAEKFKRGKMAFELRDAKEHELPAEDIALVKRLIAKLYGPAVVFRAYQMLDPAEK